MQLPENKQLTIAEIFDQNQIFRTGVNELVISEIIYAQRCPGSSCLRYKIERMNVLISTETHQILPTYIHAHRLLK